METLATNKLLAGDVLLYQGSSFLGGLIRWFDGTEYNHASIFDGKHVIEALGNGINTRSVANSIKGSKVDVYRLRKGGKFLGDPGFPADKVISSIRKISTNPQRYAYEEILLLAVLVTTRRVPLPYLRWILDNAASLIAKLLAAGKEPMICSELVYRAFLGAGSEYTPKILGTYFTGSQITKLALPPTVEPIDEDPECIRAKIEFLELYLQASAKDEETVDTFVTAAAKGNPNPNFITPGDLKKSPELHHMGTLKIS